MARLRLNGPLVAAAVFTAVAVWAGVECRRCFAELERLGAARLGEMGVDLSRPGEASATFLRPRGGCLSGYYLEVSDRPAGRPAYKLTWAIAAELTVADADGREVERLTFAQTEDPAQPDDRACLGTGSHLPPGEYTMTVRVHRGDPALAGRPATVYYRPWLCGLEAYPGLIAGMVAVAAGLPAVALWLWGLRRAVRARGRSEETRPS